jgi:hypothetical protein
MQSSSDPLKFSILYTLTALANPTGKVIDPEIRLLTKSFASRRRNASVLQELLQVLGKHISVVLAIDGCNDALHCNSALPG